VEKRFDLARFGKHLWLRERAREIKPHLQKLLEDLKVGDILVIDIDGVEALDQSFANEFFVITISSLPVEHPGRFLIFENLSEYMREQLQIAFERFNLAVIERRKDGHLHLFGKVHPSDKETFAAILKAGGSATASELKEQLGVNQTAMNERLTKLTNLALVRRDKARSSAGREQYQYWTPAP
jgi:predicted transcriptional regulator